MSLPTKPSTALEYLDTWLTSMTSVREIKFTYENERGEVTVHYTRNPAYAAPTPCASQAGDADG